MKKLVFLFILLTVFITSSKAQSFDIDNIFAGGNLAFAKPIGEFSKFAKGGISYNAIVGYKLSDNLGVGIEYGGALTIAIGDSTTTGTLGVDIYGLSSYLVLERKLSNFTCLQCFVRQVK